MEDAAPPVDQSFDPNDPSLFVDRPKWPKVVGIFSIIFGSISVFCGSAGLALMPVWRGLTEQAVEGDPLPPSVILTPIDWAAQGLGIAVNILLIIAGAACVSRKSATRGLHIFYALSYVIATVVAAYAQYQKQMAMRDYAEQYDNQIAQQQQAAGSVGIIIGAAMILLFLSWPVFSLIWFGLVKTKASDLTGAPASDNPYG